MKTTLTVRDGGDFSDPPLELNLLLAYEDEPTAARAKCALDHVLIQPEVKAHPQFHLWKLDELADAQQKERALQAATAADILVVSMHGKNRLAAGAEACLKQWVGMKRPKPCALVISLDADAKSLTETNPSLTELRTAAVRNGVTVLLQFAEPPRSDIEAVIADIQHRANSMGYVLDAIMRQPEPYPHWGLNE